MSDLEKLLADARSDQALLNELFSAQDYESAAGKAQKLGYSVTAEELQSCLDSEDIELPGEVLTAVAGGWGKKKSNPNPQPPAVTGQLNIPLPSFFKRW